jgi:excisionase family DNA binding protein
VQRRVPLMSPNPGSGAQVRGRVPRNVPPAIMVSGARSTGFEPVTSGVTGRCSPRPERVSPSKSLTLHRSNPELVVRIPRAVTSVPQAFGPTLVQVAQGWSRNPLQKDEGRLLTVREAAFRLRVSPSTVYALCDAQRLPHLRVSNAIRISVTGLEAFVRQDSART